MENHLKTASLLATAALIIMLIACGSELCVPEVAPPVPLRHTVSMDISTAPLVLASNQAKNIYAAGDQCMRSVADVTRTSGTCE